MVVITCVLLVYSHPTSWFRYTLRLLLRELDVSRYLIGNYWLIAVLVLLAACTAPVVPSEPKETRSWLAGDHHIHSRYSVGWDRSKKPPTPIIAGDAIYPIAKNAAMAEQFGLSWMVATDHGGPNHSKVNRDLAYPELLQARQAVPGVVQFYGMELNTPAGDHSSLIVPHSHNEAEVLFQLESSFDKREAYPNDPSRDTEAHMIKALQAMKALPQPPIVIANHPSRSARAYGQYGRFDPAEFRHWHDTAPEVAIGMAGAPGHQALALSNSPRITHDNMRMRGGYRGYSTLGGFDQMTAKLGGFWDSMLAEGRHWWITANSDSHVHYTQGGADFWPGEYSKTYVFADKNHASIMDNLRAGHVFVTTGDLISELYVQVLSAAGSAAIGDDVTLAKGSEVVINIRLRDPEQINPGGDNPKVRRVDLIVGKLSGAVADQNTNANPSTKVIKRFGASDWLTDGPYVTMRYTLKVDGPMYLRVRGTNTDELEPENDPAAENPWHDLWFYSNPIFLNTP